MVDKGKGGVGIGGLWLDTGTSAVENSTGCECWVEVKPNLKGNFVFIGIDAYPLADDCVSMSCCRRGLMEGLLPPLLPTRRYERMMLDIGGSMLRFRR